MIQDSGLGMPLSVEVSPNPIKKSTRLFSWHSKAAQLKSLKFLKK